MNSMTIPMDGVNQAGVLRGNDQMDSNDQPILDETLLGASSQHSNYSMFGDDDITELIMMCPTQTVTYPAEATESSSSELDLAKRKASDLSSAPTTQSVAPGPPDSSASETSLGKRKASDATNSTSSVTSATGPFRPSKLQRSTLPSTQDDDDNPFIDGPKIPANPFAPISISPSKTLQGMFDAKKLPYGVQYEIARYVSRGKLQYKEIFLPWIDKLAKLETNQGAVPALKKFLAETNFNIELNDGDDFESMFAKERAARSPWMELDREEEALSLNPLGGLGFNDKGEYLDWYGGQVLFHGKLHDKAAKGCKKPTYQLVLEPAELGPSNMFARRFGSKHFFRLKLTKTVINKSIDELMDFLRRPFILCGIVFRAFYAKDSNVFYVKTNESTDGITILNAEPVPNVKSFLEFLDWHNPIEHNNHQTMAKYVSRFALGLSSSVPGIKIEQRDIKFIDDIESAAGSNMTDGAGKINRWSLNQIRHRLQWEEKPTAIQTRIFGTKGLLVDDGKHAGECTYVELTPSQQKIHFPNDVEMDAAHRIIDVLRASHTKSPCRLSVETIINLAENGVKKKVFLDLLHTSLLELVEPLLEWESPDAMRKLWCNVRRLGGVMSARRAREQTGLARVMGYSEREAEEAELEDEDGFRMDDPAEQRSLAWWGDEVSGCPSSLEETIMCLIDSGFTPQDCPVLCDKLGKFIKARVNNYVKSYRIDVPMSASAFLVPDTSGILEPGEVFFKSSKRQFKTPDGMETDLFIGDVLVTRHPCKLPTDIQKWKSVDKPGLYHLTDVIVCSTKGDRRAADLLSGGDYDGDKGTFIWQPELVGPFKNADLCFSQPPADIKTHFARENEEVPAFRQRTKDTSVDNQIRHFQHHLLGAIRHGSVVGKYSTFHEIAIYTLGYRNPETIRLAYMFCMTLDGIKTGMTVSKLTMQTDTQKYQKRPPLWKESEEERARFEGNEKNITRPKSLGNFIMDDLYKQATTEGRNWMVKLGETFNDDGPFRMDPDLALPWEKACELAKRCKNEANNERMLEDLKLIQAHVETLYSEHRQEMAPSPRKAVWASPKKDKSGFSNQPIEVRQDKMRALSKKFASGPPLKDLLLLEEDVARLRASYAYIFDYNFRKRYTRFPFDMAMRELCQIKARAGGRSKTVAGDFYDHFNIKHPKTHNI